MINYGSNTVLCRRKSLFKHFLFYDDLELGISKCHCCDVCAIECDCSDCSMPS